MHLCLKIFFLDSSSSSEYTLTPTPPRSKKQKYSYSDKIKMLDFYRSPKQGFSKINTMKTRFRGFEDADMQMLRRFEKDQKDRAHTLKIINDEVLT